MLTARVPSSSSRTWAPGSRPRPESRERPRATHRPSPATVVGVARPTRYRELVRPRATLYVPAEQFIAAAEMLVLRTASPLASVTRLVREHVRAVDPDVQVAHVAPFRTLLQGPLARPRFN